MVFNIETFNYRKNVEKGIHNRKESAGKCFTLGNLIKQVKKITGRESLSKKHQ